MAQDLQLDFNAGAAYTITMNSVADGGNATATTVDLGTPAPMEIVLEFSGASSASGTDFIEFYVMWSHDNTDFTDAANAEFVKAIKMNATSTVKSVFSFPVKARYHKIYFKNESNATMASSGNALNYIEVAIDQA